MGNSFLKTVHASSNNDLSTSAEQEFNEDVLNLQVPAKVKNIHVDGLSVSRNELVAKQLHRLFDVNTFDRLMTEAHLCKLKLERLGVFSGIEVFIDVTKESKENDFDVYYFVKESRRLAANVGTEVGHNEGSMSMGGRINNLRGSGECVRANASIGSHVSSSYEFAFSKPLRYDPDQKLTIRAIRSLSDYVQSEYKEDAKGLALEMTYPSSIGLHTVAWDYLWRENLINKTAPFDVRLDAGHSLKSSIRHSFVSDGRDDWIFPAKGHRFKHNMEYSGIGGSVKALKTDVEIQLNKEILPDIVTAFTLNTGTVKSLSNSPLLINDRHFVGGPLSVRGYAMKGIGEHAKHAAVGGEVFFASGLHLYTPLPFRPGQGGFGDLFRMHFFANAGNISNAANLDLKDFLSNPRYSYGLGLMFMLGGMARLEVNYCIPKNARPGDIINQGWQIGVGINFL